MTKKFRKNIFIALLIVCAIMIGFINVLPDILAKNSLANEGEKYFPFAGGGDNTYAYGSRIREPLDGHLIVRDVNIYEHKNYPPFWPPLPPLLNYPILKLTNDIVASIIISNFVFPAIIFLLLYLLAFVITKKKFLSLFFASFFALYHEASINFPPFIIEHLKDFIKMFIPFDVGNNSVASALISRESFIPSFPIFLSAIIFFYLNYKYNKKIYIILAGIFYALSAYSYPFHFIHLSAALFILLIILCFQRKWQIVKRLFLSFFISLAVLTPFFYWQIKLKMLPQYRDIFSRYGPELSHAFRISYWKEYIWYLFISGFVILWGEKTKKQKIAYFIISFILAGILCLNMQTVLGFNLEPRHWEIRTIFLGLSLGWLIAFWWVGDYFKKYNKSIFIVFSGVLIIIFLAVHAIHVKYNEAKENYHFYVMPEYKQESFNWLNNNTEIDSVVVSPAFSTNIFITMHTHNNIFIPMGINSLAPEEEAIERLIITYKIFEVKREQLDKLLNQQRNKDYQGLKNLKSLDRVEAEMQGIEQSGKDYLFGSMKFIGNDFDMDTRYAKTTPRQGIPQKLYEEIINKFDSLDMKEALGKYRADYLYFGPMEKEISTADFMGYKKVYDNLGVEIYEFKNEKLVK